MNSLRTRRHTLGQFVGGIRSLDLLAFLADACGDGRLILALLLLVLVLITTSRARL